MSVLLLLIILNTYNAYGSLHLLVAGCRRWPLIFRLWLAICGVMALWVCMSASAVATNYPTTLHLYQDHEMQVVAATISFLAAPIWPLLSWIMQVKRMQQDRFTTPRRVTQ